MPINLFILLKVVYVRCRNKIIFFASSWHMKRSYIQYIKSFVRQCGEVLCVLVISYSLYYQDRKIYVGNDMIDCYCLLLIKLYYYLIFESKVI